MPFMTPEQRRPRTLQELSDRATPGPWRRSHGTVYGPGPNGPGALVAMFGDIQYLNHTDDPRKSMANARFVCALVEAYRAGKLKEVDNG